MPGAAVVSQLVRQATRLGSVDIHIVDVKISVAGRSKDDLLSVRRDRALSVVAIRRRETLQIRPVRLSGEDVESPINRPHIPLRAICWRRTIRRPQMRRGINDSFTVRSEVTAGC